MTRVAAYCRVSTEQEDQVNSFLSQQRYFEEYISQKPTWELHKIYADEGVSGTSTKRRIAFRQMMEEAQQGCFSLILTKEVSRFSRNILDTIACTRALRQYGVGVLFLSDGIDTRDADAELRLSIMGSIAQEESRRTSARVKWGQTRRMEQGVVFGTSLLGYTVRDGKITVEPIGAEIVRRVFYQYGVEKRGTSDIARGLRAAGYRTSRGSAEWSNSHIIKLLRNEKYVGDLIQKKSVTPDYLSHAKKYNHGEEPLVILRDHHEAIISRTLWNTVQEELHRRSRRGGGSGHAVQYPFSGKIWCGVCGAAFVSRQKRRRDGTVYQRWACGKVKCSIGWSVTDASVRTMMYKTLQNIPFDRKRFAHITAVCVVTAMESSEGGKKAAREQLGKEITRLKQKRVQALDAFLDGAFMDSQLQEVTARYDECLSVLQAQVAEEKSVSREPDHIAGFFEGILCGSVESDAFYRAILDRIEVRQDGTATVRLKNTAEDWIFAVRRNKKGKNNPAVPTSVNTPLHSL